MLKINIIKCEKRAKNGTAYNIGLENKLLLSKSFCVMITKNFLDIKKADQ